MEAIEVFRAHLLRSDVNQSWGFQLQGGSEVHQPLKISNVAVGSVAEATGLRVEDVLVEVNGASTLHLSHSQVIETLRRVTGEDLLMTIERKSKPLDKKGGSDVTAVESTEVKEDKRSQTTKEGVSLPVKSAEEIKFEENRKTRGTAGVPHPESHFAASAGPQPLQPQPQPQLQSYSSGPQRTPFEFQTVQSRPFVEPVSRHSRRPNPSSSSSSSSSSTQPPRHFYQPPQPQQPASSRDVEESLESPEYYQRDEEVPQSRTFRLLQSVMSNEEQGAGVEALPPPKSASLERMKSDGSSHGSSSPRVKVLVAQKYNSPLGMYSADNAIETFAAQAESAIESIEKQQQQSIGPEYHPVFSSPRQQ